jgi:hemerythrin-like metal-binding protein
VKPIDIFPWDDHFKVGIPTIDQQHYRLVELLNQLAREVVFASQFSRLDEIFNDLLDYTIYHFQTEETIWETNFPNDLLQTEHKKSSSKLY